MEGSWFVRFSLSGVFGHWRTHARTHVSQTPAIYIIHTTAATVITSLHTLTVPMVLLSFIAHHVNISS